MTGSVGSYRVICGKQMILRHCRDSDTCIKIRSRAPSVLQEETAEQAAVITAGERVGSRAQGMWCAVSEDSAQAAAAGVTR